MNVNVVRIGNSRGIRIPKQVLDQCQIADAVDLRVEENRIVLEPVTKQTREGWAREAQAMHEAGDDELLIPDVLDGDVELEWQ